MGGKNSVGALFLIFTFFWEYLVLQQLITNKFTDCVYQLLGAQQVYSELISGFPMKTSGWECDFTL